MKFLFPAFLFALLTIAIPIIIHLFNFRRYKTVYFSNVGFLKNIKKESKKKSRLKQLLILLARILTIIFLVFAFSQPYIPIDRDRKKQQNQTVAVYIDNSFSMNALSEKGQLLEVARNKALEICLAYTNGTKFRIFTNDLEPKHQHVLNREQFIKQVSEIELSPTVVPISLVHNRFSLQSSSNETEDEKNLFLISDFQRSVSDVENFTNSNVFSYFLPLRASEVNNLYIDSCWVEVPAHRLNQEENIYVKIKNSSRQDYQNLPLKLFLNDSLKSITSFNVKAQNEIVANLKYTNNSAGPQLGKIEITDYPFTHDNNWFISYYVEPNLKALAIYNTNTNSNEGLNYISALFENDDFVQLDKMNVNSLQINKLATYNTIFLINPENFTSGLLNEIQNVVNGGTSVVLFPESKGDQSHNNTFLSTFNANLISGFDTTQQEISGIDFDNKFFTGVFKKKEDNAVLSKINGHLKFNETIKTTERKLLWFQNGDKALSSIPAGEGKVWIFAFPLEKRNEAFARDILFVPIIYNIVLNSLPQQQSSFTIGKNKFIDLPEGKKLNLSSALKFIPKKSGEEFIPEKSVLGKNTRIEFGDLAEDAGHYYISDDEQIISTLAFNFDRKESDLRYFSDAEIREKIGNNANLSVIEHLDKDFSEIFEEIQNGKQLWKWCIFLALFFIVCEVLIARFWK